MPRGLVAARHLSGAARSHCSATSASRPRPWPPDGCATRNATSAGPPCSAPSRARWSTSWGPLAVFGTVPHSDLLGSTAPFTDSANAIFGGPWAGNTSASAADHLGVRRADRLDLDRGRDAAGGRSRRTLPHASFAAREPSAGCRRSGSSPSTVLASALTRGQLHLVRPGVHHHRAAVGAHLGDPLPLLRRGPALLAGHAGARGSSGSPGAGPDRGAARPGVLVLDAGGQRTSRPSTTASSACCSACPSTCGQGRRGEYGETSRRCLEGGAR